MSLALVLAKNGMKNGMKIKNLQCNLDCMLAPNKQPRHIHKKLLELTKGYGGRCGHYWRQIVSICDGTLRGDGPMCSKMRGKKFIPKNGTKHRQLLWWDTNKIGLRVLFSGLLTKMCVRSGDSSLISSTNCEPNSPFFQVFCLHKKITTTIITLLLSLVIYHYHHHEVHSTHRLRFVSCPFRLRSSTPCSSGWWWWYAICQGMYFFCIVGLSSFA